jgi:hypothetical protein
MKSIKAKKTPTKRIEYDEKHKTGKFGNSPETASASKFMSSNQNTPRRSGNTSKEKPSAYESPSSFNVKKNSQSLKQLAAMTPYSPR